LILLWDACDVNQYPNGYVPNLVEDVVLTPGMAGTLPELQQAGFRYVK
jgi:hypothetical protein